MYILGVTGGIASGKSTVCATLSGLVEKIGGHHLAVIDADKLGHKAYTTGGPCYTAIVEHFGSGVVAPGGEIDRRALGSIVFSNSQRMRELEALVWPTIRGFIEQELLELTERETQNPRVPVIVVLEAAVMLEAGWNDLCSSLWVVHVDPLVARARLVARNALTPEEADKRISAQMTNSKRLSTLRECDVSIDNSGSAASLALRVNEAFRSCMARSNPFFRYISPLIARAREGSDEPMPFGGVEG